MDADTPLPVLRPDLEIHDAGRDSQGGSIYTVHDPVAMTYDRIGWREYEILRRLGAGKSLRELLTEIVSETTLRPSVREVLNFCNDARRRGLTRNHRLPAEHSRSASLRHEGAGSKLGWIFSHYLYTRIPLWHPDSFLEKTLRHVLPLASRPALLFYALISFSGVLLLFQRTELYAHSFANFFTWPGLLSYGIVMTLVKAAHEFSHAYTAKRYGVRVTTMGVALILLWPVPYCDVTDAWKLRERGKRFRISAAGMLAELVIAGIALFLWAIVPEGSWKSIFFLLSSGSLISSLVTNLNPGMRFDGYYILSDIWGVDNLQQKGFAAAKWFFRKAFLGLHAPRPAYAASRKQLAGLLVYALFSWAYRFFLFLAIAGILYARFTKIMGIFLAAGAVFSFIGMPILQEAKFLYQKRKTIRMNPRLCCTVAALILLLLWLALPLRRRISLPAVIVPLRTASLYAPGDGRLHYIRPIRELQRVERDTELCSVESDPRRALIKRLRIEEKALAYRIRILSTVATETERMRLQQAKEEGARIVARLKRLRQIEKQSVIRCPFPGTVLEWDEELQNGTYVRGNMVLGRIADISSARIVAYITEEELGDLKAGQRAEFFSPALKAGLEARIKSIESTPAATLEYPALAAANGGSISASPTEENRWKMRRTYYRLEARPSDPPSLRRFAQSGALFTITARRHSYLRDALRYLLRIGQRESAF